MTLKYVVILLRADNNGEGGTLALMALAPRAVGRVGKAGGVVALLGIISGRCSTATPSSRRRCRCCPPSKVSKSRRRHSIAYVVPLTVVILLVLFAVQSRGTAKVAALFGPIMVVWFVAIAVPGLIWHRRRSRQCCWRSIRSTAWSSCCITAWSACSRSARCFSPSPAPRRSMPISGISAAARSRSAWLALVLPALALNYLGQGALVYAHPEAIENPFFLMYPDWALIPMVVLATAATVIASQAVITGAYSLTSQAIQLGLLPRFEIRHTSARQAGQIYMPRVNGLLLIGVLLLVALFRSSSALASAYGIAVTGTMVVTCMMAFIVIWRLWRWSLLAAAALIVPFLLIDLTFLSANMLKVVRGRLGAAGARRRGDAGDVYVAPRQPDCSTRRPGGSRRRWKTWCACSSASRRSACRARRCSSPAIRKARRPR